MAGMRVRVVSGTAAFPETAPERDAQGYYQIGGVAPGTFQVAVHDRDGQRVGLESVVVKSGETATLNFSISTGAAAQDPPPQASSISTKEPTDGRLCLPAAQLVWRSC